MKTAIELNFTTVSELNFTTVSELIKYSNGITVTIKSYYKGNKVFFFAKNLNNGKAVQFENGVFIATTNQTLLQILHDTQYEKMELMNNKSYLKVNTDYKTTVKMKA